MLELSVEKTYVVSYLLWATILVLVWCVSDALLALAHSQVSFLYEASNLEVRVRARKSARVLAPHPLLTSWGSFFLFGRLETSVSVSSVGPKSPCKRDRTK